MGVTAHVVPRRRVLVLAFVVLALALVALFALERTNTGASTVSHISTIPASSHKTVGDDEDHKGKKTDDEHHKPPPRCDDDRKGEHNKHCRPPSGKPKDR